MFVCLLATSDEQAHSALDLLKAKITEQGYEAEVEELSTEEGAKEEFRILMVSYPTWNQAAQAGMSVFINSN